MSSRRVTSATMGGKPKASILASTKHIVHPKMNGDRDKNSSELSSWWKENESTFSPIFSFITLLCLYGITFYLPYFRDQSIQFFVCSSLFALSLLFTSHYLKAIERRKVENKVPLTWIRNSPPNLRKSETGEHVLNVWTPSKYSETVFLNYSPLIPLIGYIWVRSFEPFVSWVCVILMGLSSALLHILNLKLRSQFMNELLLFKEPTSVGKRLFNEDEPTARVNNPTPEPPPIYGPSTTSRSPVRMAYEPPRRYDGPASAVFQVPIQSDPHSPQPEYAHLQSHEPYKPDVVDPFIDDHREYHQDPPMKTDNYFSPSLSGVPESIEYSYSQSPHLTYQQNQDYQEYHEYQQVHQPNHQNFQNHQNQPNQPQTPSHRKFGLRFGATLDSPPHPPSSQQKHVGGGPSSSEHQRIGNSTSTPMRGGVGVGLGGISSHTQASSMAPATPNAANHFDEFDRFNHFDHTPQQNGHDPMHQNAHYTPAQSMGAPQTPLSAARNFGITPSKGFAPPPRFSMQDFD